MTKKFSLFFFPHNLKRHPTSSSFGLNLANVFSFRMSQIMSPDTRRLLFMRNGEARKKKVAFQI